MSKLENNTITLSPATTQPATDQEILRNSFALALGIDGNPKEIVAKYTAETLPTLVIKDSNDKDGYERVKKAHGLAVKTRTTIDKQKTELNRPYIDQQKQNVATAKELIELVAPIENTLKERLDAYENALRLEEEAKEKARLEAIKAREKQLYEAGAVFSGTLYVCGTAYLTPEQVEHTDDAFFNNALELFKGEKARLEQEQQAANEKAAAEAKELEELRQLKAQMDANKQAEDRMRSRVNGSGQVTPVREDTPTNSLNDHGNYPSGNAGIVGNAISLKQQQAAAITELDANPSSESQQHEPEYGVSVVASSDNDVSFVKQALAQIVMECKLASGDAKTLLAVIAKIQGLAETATEKL